MTKRIYPTEAKEQAALFCWAALNTKKHPDLRCLYAIPNGGSRYCLEAANLKKQGVKPGVSDVHLPVARRGYFGLWLELKRTKGGRVTQAQNDWLELMTKQGHYAEIVYGFEAARLVLEWYLSGERTEVNLC